MCFKSDLEKKDIFSYDRRKVFDMSLSIYPLSLRPKAPQPLDMSDKYNFGKLYY